MAEHEWAMMFLVLALGIFWADVRQGRAVKREIKQCEALVEKCQALLKQMDALS